MAALRSTLAAELGSLPAPASLLDPARVHVRSGARTLGTLAGIALWLLMTVGRWAIAGAALRGAHKVTCSLLIGAGITSGAFGSKSHSSDALAGIFLK